MGSTKSSFEKTPLAGARYVLTRPEGSGKDLVLALEEAGAGVERFPVIRFGATGPEGLGRIAELISGPSGFAGWIVLPSPRAVKSFFRVLGNENSDQRFLDSAKIAVIGEASRAACETLGRRPDFVPSAANGATLARELPLAQSTRVVVAGAEKTRRELIEGLRRRGAEVEHIALYRTVPVSTEVVAMAEFVGGNKVDGCIVYSPSAVESIVRHWPGSGKARLEELVWFAVGPTTDAALRANGLKSAGVAARPNAQTVLRCIVSIHGREDGAREAEKSR